MVQVTSSPPTFQAAPNGKVRWTIDLVYAADAAGFFKPGDRYELIDGELLLMSPPKPPHQAAVRKVVRMLRQTIAAETDLEIETGGPSGLGDFDVPVPDIMLIRDDLYEDRHPGADDTFLIVEVANSHPERDRQPKRQQYARFDIADYWIVDLKKKELVVHRDPQNGDYQQVTVWQDDTITLARLPQVSVNMEALRQWIFS